MPRSTPVSQNNAESQATNPHFDLDLLVWSDDYSGCFQPPPDEYFEQFDEKWRLVLEDASGTYGFNQGAGVQLDDDAIDLLVYEWTGKWDIANSKQPQPQRRVIAGAVPEKLIRNKKCIDAGCGNGRWTRVIQELGAAEVLSVDVSEHSLKSVSRFNSQTLQADLSQLSTDHPDLVDAFDFANLWGVAHHTHDPRETFMQVASTVKSGGSIYVMLYDVDGHHATQLTNNYRKVFASLTDPDERLGFVAAVADRRWHKYIPMIERLKNIRRNILSLPKSNKIGVLDRMMPWYNWTVPVDVAVKWMKDAGFKHVEVLNDSGSASRHYLATSKR